MFNQSLILVIPFLFLLKILFIALSNHSFVLCEISELKGQSNYSNKQLVVDLILLIVLFDAFQMLKKFLRTNVNTHILQNRLKTQFAYDLPLVDRHVELFLKVYQFSAGIKLIQRNMLSPVDSSVSTYFFNRFLEDSCRIFQSNLIKRRQDIWISKMLLTFDFN